MTSDALARAIVNAIAGSPTEQHAIQRTKELLESNTTPKTQPGGLVTNQPSW